MQESDLASELETLVELAEQILSGDPNSAEFVDWAEDYAQAFGRWFDRYTDSAVVLAAERVRDLLTLHEKILERLGLLQGETSQAMTEFRKRARGIMAYTDILPRRLSVAKNRQG